MPLNFLILLLAAIAPLTGCAAPHSLPPATPAAPLPDARDLGEHPLDVIDLPQP